MYIANAFSLQMTSTFPATFTVVEVDPKDIPVDIQSAIGHTDTAAVVSGILGIDLPAARVNVALSSGDTLFVAQVVGGRLPEGTTTLPAGVSLKFLRVDIA